MYTTTLNNSVNMPMHGLGVFLIDEETTADTVYTAIKNGYRSIDTAAIYGNETGVGIGIKRALDEEIVTREQLFITSKVWNDHGDFAQTIEAYHDSLAKLQLAYLDLYLIHWPGDNRFIEPWKAMEQLYNDNRVRAIGVCNFTVAHLKALLEVATITPAINQIELHPKLQQRDMREFAAAHHIQLEAWGPLMQGGLFENDVLQQLATKYERSISQIILRWDFQQGIVAIPKSTKEARMIQNAAIFDFELTAEDLAIIDAMDEDKRVGPNPSTYNFEL